VNESSHFRLHHVGFVVQDIARGLHGLASLTPVWDGQIYHDPNQKVRVAFVGTGGPDALIELVEPVGEDSPVWRFSNRKAAACTTSATKWTISRVVWRRCG